MAHETRLTESVTPREPNLQPLRKIYLKKVYNRHSLYNEVTKTYGVLRLHARKLILNLGHSAAPINNMYNVFAALMLYTPLEPFTARYCRPS